MINVNNSEIHLISLVSTTIFAWKRMGNQKWYKTRIQIQKSGTFVLGCSWLLGSWLTLREREEASVRVLHSRMGRACIMAWYGSIISSLASLLFCVASNLWRSLHNLMQFRRKKIHMVWMDFPIDFLIRWGIFGVWIWRLIKLLRWELAQL